MSQDTAAQPVIVLGAGHGKRMGGPKVFAKTGNAPFLAHILNRVREARSRAILTVDPQFRARVETLIAELPPVPVRLVEADGTLPMLASVHAGMKALDPEDMGAWLWPVDAPLLSAAGWQKACATVAAHPEHVLKLRTGGRTGHPTWFPRWACVGILAGTWEEGLLGYLATVPSIRVALLELPGETLSDFNTPEQLAAVRP